MAFGETVALLANRLGSWSDGGVQILIAGATGAIGLPIITQLIDEGHDVVGLARDESGAAILSELGAEAVVGNAMDPDSAAAAVRAAEPEVIIDQLTALPRHYTPEAMRAALNVTVELRTIGGANLQAAAEVCGVSKYIVQSSCYYYEPGDGLADESAPFAHNAPELVAKGVQAFESVEARVLGSTRLTGVALRYGFFYGPGTWYWPDNDIGHSVQGGLLPIVGDGQGVYSFVHVDDAADATIIAATTDLSGAYNVTDDDPSPVSTWLPAFAHWVGGPAPRHVPAEGADPDAVFYNMQLRGASNAAFKKLADWQPRRLMWLED